MFLLKVLEDWDAAPTFSDGTAGGVEPGSVTLEITKQYVDEWVLLEEEDIEQAVYDMMDKGNKIVEGAAGLAVAGLRKMGDRLRGKNVALVLCGGNLGMKNVAYIMNRYHEPGE